MIGTAARTVTFLFTDIEGSTRLWDESPETMAGALVRHDALVREAILANGGQPFKSVGDAFYVAFDEASKAARAALAVQRALAAETWPTPRPIRVRAAVHTGVAEARGGDYFGPALNRVARLLVLGHGGQTLVSGAAQDGLGAALPPGAELVPLGEHRLRDLVDPEDVFGLVAPGLVRDFPPLRSLAPFRKGNLPAEATSFVGREAELLQIARTLERTRLVTLLGPGGTGKTRLSLRAAAAARKGLPGGAWFVDLSPVTEPAGVAPTVADALGTLDATGRPLEDAVADVLREAPALVVLDNCEHLLEAAGRLAEALIRKVPTLRLVATSRKPLGVPGETVLRVRALSLPRDETDDELGRSEAARLFVERATAQRGDFAVTSANAPAIVSLCRRLDGLPLALELAAARVRSLTVEGIEARLDDRFRLLTVGSRTALPRQQTLRALVDWSHDLLGEAERTALRRLAVFVGGWTLEAAEAVVPGDDGERGDVVDLLASLVDKSLVTAEPTDGDLRYGMLHTVREYATERLGESGEEAAVRRRHAAFFAAMAGMDGPQCRQDGAAVRRLAADWDNLRTAMDRATAAQRLDMAAALDAFWNFKGAFQEGRERCVAALREDSPPSDDVRRWAVAKAASWFALQLGDRPSSIAWAEDGVRIARARGDAAREALVLGNLAVALAESGELAHAREVCETAIRLGEDPILWINMAKILRESGEPEAACAALERADALAQARPNGYLLYFLDWYCGCLAYDEERLTEAEARFRSAQDRAVGLEGTDHFLETALALSECQRARGRLDESLATCRTVLREAKTDLVRRAAHLALARAAVDSGEFAEGRAALRHVVRLVSPLYAPEMLETAAALLAATGKPREASVLLAAAAEPRRARPMPLRPIDRKGNEVLLASLRDSLEAEELAAATAEGASLGLEAANARVLSLLD